MSAEDLPGVPVGTADDSEDVSKAAIEVQAEVHADAEVHAEVEVHTDAKADQNGGTIRDTHANSNGTELDPIASEERDVLGPLTKQTSTDTTGIVSVGSGTSVTYSAGKEKDDSFVVQMTSNPGDTEKTPQSPKYTRMASLKKQPSLLRRFSQDSSLSLQQSWRTKSGQTRLKNKKNYISYHNITYTVPQGRFFQKKSPKVILNDIRLVVNKHES